MTDCIPCLVERLGKAVGMTPIAWTEYPDRLVIVFEQGPKLTFHRDTEPLREIEIQAQAETQPVKKVEKPASKPRKTRKK